MKLNQYGQKKKANQSDIERAVIKEFKDRFSKWHLRQIDTVTFLINLLFTLSIAITGFIISNQDKPFFKNKTFGKDLSLSRSALLILTISATVGLLALVSRLNDFRITKNRIKKRRRKYELENDIRFEDIKPLNKESLAKEIQCNIWWSKFLGFTTATFFYIQIFLFVVALWVLAISA